MGSIGGGVVFAVFCIFGSEILSRLPSLLGEDAVPEVGGAAGPGGVVGVVREFVASMDMLVHVGGW